MLGIIFSVDVEEVGEYVSTSPNIYSSSFGTRHNEDTIPLAEKEAFRTMLEVMTYVKDKKFIIYTCGEQVLIYKKLMNMFYNIMDRYGVRLSIKDLKIEDMKIYS